MYCDAYIVCCFKERRKYRVDVLDECVCVELAQFSGPKKCYICGLCVHHHQRRNEPIQTQHLGKDKNQNHADV
jgi:hypothetical protein